MLFYKNPDNKVFSFDSEADMVKAKVPDLIEITKEEAEKISNTETRKYKRFFGNDKLDLFTEEEQLAIITATLTDVKVKLFYDRLLSASFLTYEDQQTETGLLFLVSKNLLTEDRKAEIIKSMLY